MVPMPTGAGNYIRRERAGGMRRLCEPAGKGPEPTRGWSRGKAGPGPVWAPRLALVVVPVQERSAHQTRVPHTQVTEAFAALSAQWRRDTAHLSSVTEIVLHPAYQQIIGMGPAVLPLIVRELRRETGHWFWALGAITGENPVSDEDAGKMRRMRDAWLRLADEKGWAA